MQKRGSRRISSIFPTIEENDEVEEENQEEGIVANDLSPNELSPYVPYSKVLRSSSTQSGRKISSGNKPTIFNFHQLNYYSSNIEYSNPVW